MESIIRSLFSIIISLTFLSACKIQPSILEPILPEFINEFAANDSTPQTNQLVKTSDVKPPPSVSFDHISVEDSLAHSEVWAIAQDPLGFLWFGTSNGLSKYDGHSFKTYRNDPEDVGSLSDNYVTALFVDSTGNLWVGVGTPDGVLERFNRIEETFTHYDITQSIFDITEDTAGNLWLGTIQPGLVRFNPRKGEMEIVWGDSYVRGVDIDGGGNIWAASSESRIIRVNPVTGVMDEFNLEHKIWDLASGRYTNSILLFHPARFTAQYARSTSIPRAHCGLVVMWMHEGPSGQLWLATMEAWINNLAQ